MGVVNFACKHTVSHFDERLILRKHEFERIHKVFISNVSVNVCMGIAISYSLQIILSLRFRRETLTLV